MQRQLWFPLMTSVGVGAAVYYGMTRSSTRVGRMLRQMVPYIPTLAGVNPNQSGQQASMQTSGTDSYPLTAQ